MGYIGVVAMRSQPFIGLLISLTLASLAHGQELAHPCAGIDIVTQGTLATRWNEPVARLCAEIATLHDIDPNAALLIVAAGDDLIVEAHLGDGRVALRRVQTADSLMFAIEALMVLPAATAEAPVAVEVPAAVAAPISDDESHRSNVEIGVALVGRVARAPTYLSGGLETYGGFRTGEWISGVLVRWDPVQRIVRTATPQSFETSSFGAGFLLARRAFRARSVAMDLGVNTVVMALMHTFTVSGAETVDTDLDARIGLMSRVILGRSAVRCSVLVEADVSPLRLSGELRVAPNLPTLPTWSLGIGLGFTWGEQ